MKKLLIIIIMLNLLSATHAEFQHFSSPNIDTIQLRDELCKLAKIETIIEYSSVGSIIIDGVLFLFQVINPVTCIIWGSGIIIVFMNSKIWLDKKTRSIENKIIKTRKNEYYKRD